MTNSDGLFGEPNVVGDRQQRWRPYLAAIADLELRKTAGLTPAIQVGVGSGIRVGIRGPLGHQPVAVAPGTEARRAYG